MRTRRLFWLVPFFFLACKQGGNVPVTVADVGFLIVDSNFVIDEFPYDSAACAEVIPEGRANADSIPSGSVAVVKVVSTACYWVQVKVENDSGVLVRTFDNYFKIYNRRNGDKNTGREGYLSWNGKNDAGMTLPRARYLWRLNFNFGLERTRRARADIRLD